MKKYLFFWTLVLCFGVVTTHAQNKNEASLQKKSQFAEQYGSYPNGTTYPLPFNELSNARAAASPSTGYYFYDNNEAAITTRTDIWRPSVNISTTDTTYQPTLWTRVLPGPRIVAKTYWENNPKGKHFFRNPADILTKDIYDPAGGKIDTTTNAIAGPMPIGINGGFYFNGIRYDSFYVSQTGVIALTNRRYIYDQGTGLRTVPSGTDNCYDVYSQDWFIGGIRNRETLSGKDGKNDATPDDFGYTASVLGRNPNVTYTNPASDPFFTATSGLRHVGLNDISYITSLGYATENCKPALIAPFWGNVALSQYNAKYQVAEDYGKVYFKTTENKDALIIAYYNVAMYGNITNVPTSSYNVAKDSRPGTPGYCEWDAKVILDKHDSSIVFIYEKLRRTSLNSSIYLDYSCGNLMRANLLSGVYGWARTTNYDTKNPSTEIQPGQYSYPWYSEYKQYTHYFVDNNDLKNNYPNDSTIVKFKQWKNTLKAVNMVFKIRNSKQVGDDVSYDFMDTPLKGTDYELLAGEPLLGAIQPIGLIQNLTNDIQGKKGVNFTPQDLEFKTKFEVTNIITGRKCKSTEVPVKQACLELDGNWSKCNNNEADRVRLVKELSYNADLVYSVDSEYKGYEFEDAGYDGVPPYKFANVAFSHFEPTEYIDNHIGRMNARLVVVPTTPEPENKSLGDQWPFDDTLRTRFFVMRRIRELTDDVSEFHVEKTTGWAVPSVLHWVAADAYVVSGDDVSMHALPPRGEFIQSMPDGSEVAVADQKKILSPAIEMNRTRRVPGQIIEAEPTKLDEYDTEWKVVKGLGGDELRSFPIELAYVKESDTVYCYNSTISFSLQRGKRLNPGYLQNYSRFIGEEVFIGPEAKIYYNNSAFRPKFVAGSGGTADMLVLEYAKPSSDGLNGICNIPEEDWRYLPHRKGSSKKADTIMPVLTMYGGGGYLRGFLKEDPDSILIYPTATEFNAQDESDYENYFLFDEGLDWDYKKYTVQIPDTFVGWENLGANSFRFRFKVIAKDHKQTNIILDDYDDFIIDNITLQYDQDIINKQLGIIDSVSVNATDLECMSVRLDWPYTAIPPTQATNIPVVAKVANNSNKPAAYFSVRVRIFRDEDFNKATMAPFAGKKPVYCRDETVSNLQPATEYELSMPNWDARKIQKSKTSKYVMLANILQGQKDIIPENDVTFFDAEITFDEMFAYDPLDDMVCSTGDPLNPYKTVEFPKSDVDKEIGLNIPGRGLNIKAHSYEEGVGKRLLTYEDRVGDGITTNVSSGKIAMKFELANTDTIKGFQAYFTPLNSTPNEIEFEIIRKDGFLPSDKIVAGTKLRAYRMLNPDSGELEKEKYITYKLEKPIELAADVYWLSIAQLETDGINLGATSARSGMKVSNFFQHPQNNTWATNGNSLYLDKNFREKIGEKYVNKSLFAYVNANYSNSWVQFTPTTGLIGYPHTNHQGRSLKDNQTLSYMNGTWLPMLRPYFGERKYGQAIGTVDEYQECPEVPVELVGFKGSPRQGGIELLWETASETNNAGFEIQRRLNGKTEWSILAFTKGQGNSVVKNYYNFFDKEVKMGQTYQYQLRQLDKDGSVGCSTSDIVTVTYENLADLMLSQNQPNPFSGNTSITYQIPYDADVKLEVIDIFGNVVNVLENSYKTPGTYSVVWYANDNNRNPVASGNYIYRLTVGEEVRTAKMSLIK